jgi:sterol desaturase/sphingolipid hydroxylase (fatty acid hydroxylase superfamily)
MRLSAGAYYADFFLGAAAMLYLIVDMGAQVSIVQVGQRVGLVTLGFASWTLFEYLVHRTLYHHVTFFKDQHEAHHAEPSAFIGAPPVVGIVLIFAICYLPFVELNMVVGSCLTIGMLVGYMAYMLLHHAAHHWKLPENSWLDSARRHHALHHYHRLEGNYGITTSFWDNLFGTALEPSRRVFD